MARAIGTCNYCGEDVLSDKDHHCQVKKLRAHVARLEESLRVQGEALAEKAEVIREVLPDTMGGYPDLFGPRDGWVAWEERALRAIGGEE